MFNVHDSFVNRPRCGHDDVALLQSHLCCRILVPDCSNHIVGIPSGIHVSIVGCCLLVEECAVDC